MIYEVYMVKRYDQKTEKIIIFKSHFLIKNLHIGLIWSYIIRNPILGNLCLKLTNLKIFDQKVWFSVIFGFWLYLLTMSAYIHKSKTKIPYILMAFFSYIYWVKKGFSPGAFDRHPEHHWLFFYKRYIHFWKLDKICYMPPNFTNFFNFKNKTFFLVH